LAYSNHQKISQSSQKYPTYDVILIGSGFEGSKNYLNQFKMLASGKMSAGHRPIVTIVPHINII
jgi:hypothetical protein